MDTEFALITAAVAGVAMYYFLSQNTERLTVPNSALPQSGGEAYLDSTSAVNIYRTPMILFADTKFQGAQYAAKPGEDVPFLVHTVHADGSVTREWRFKSMQFGPSATLRISANFQKNTATGDEGHVNAIKATPRFSGLPDISEYLEEDPQLKLNSTLFWVKNQAEHSIVYTIASL